MLNLCPSPQKWPYLKMSMTWLHEDKLTAENVKCVLIKGKNKSPCWAWYYKCIGYDGLTWKGGLDLHPDIRKYLPYKNLFLYSNLFLPPCA